MEKICSNSHCNELQPLSNFGKDKQKIDGLTSKCKVCRKAFRDANKERINQEARDYRVRESEDISIRRKARYANNPEPIKAKSREQYYISMSSETSKAHHNKLKTEWKANNPDKVKAYWDKHYTNNKDHYIVRSAVRRCAKGKAHLDGFEYEYKQVFKSRPDNYHVDHIIPINHPDICGLDVYWNLQHLTQGENLSKSNKFDGTNENESWRLKYNG